MAERYLNREIDGKISSLDTKVENYHQETMAELKQHRDTHTTMLEQVRMTNGRVKALELWRAGLAGGFAVLSLILVPILIALIKDII